MKPMPASAAQENDPPDACQAGFVDASDSWAEIARACGAGERADGAELTRLAQARVDQDPSALFAGAAALSMMRETPQLGSALFKRLCQINPDCGRALEQNDRSRSAFQEVADSFARLANNWTTEAKGPKAFHPKTKLDLVVISRKRFAGARDFALALAPAPFGLIAKSALLSADCFPRGPLQAEMPNARPCQFYMSALLDAMASGAALPRPMDKALREEGLCLAAVCHQSKAFRSLAALLYPEPDEFASAMAEALSRAAASCLRFLRQSPSSSACGWARSSGGGHRAREAANLVGSHMAHLATWWAGAEGLAVGSEKIFWERLLGADWHKAKALDAFESFEIFKAAAIHGRRIALSLDLAKAAKRLGLAEVLPAAHPVHGAWSSLFESLRSDKQAASLYARLAMSFPDPVWEAKCLSRFKNPERSLIERQLIRGVVDGGPAAHGEDAMPARRLRL